MTQLASVLRNAAREPSLFELRQIAEPKPWEGEGWWSQAGSNR
jgi:hypothetical protein